VSDKYKVTITVRKEIANGALVEWLSKTPQDSNVIVRTPAWVFGILLLVC
jgi:hypothetical protein